MEVQKFNKQIYDKNYQKERREKIGKDRAQFNVELSRDEMDHLNLLLAEKKLTKAQFLRNAIKNLENKN